MAFALENALCKNDFHLLTKAARPQSQQVDLQLHECFEVNQAIHQLVLAQLARLNRKVFRCPRLQKDWLFAILPLAASLASLVAFVQVTSGLPDLAEMLDLRNALHLHYLAGIWVLVARCFQLFFIDRHQFYQVVELNIGLASLIAGSSSAPAQTALISLRKLVRQGEISCFIGIVADVLLHNVLTDACNGQVVENLGVVH